MGQVSTSIFLLVCILAFTPKIATAQKPDTISKLQIGFRVDMIQTPRHFRGESRESRSFRGLWTMNDARYVLREYQKTPDLFRAKTVFMTSPLNFSDHLFQLVWSQKHDLGETFLYPLFKEHSVADIYPDLGYNHDNNSDIPMPPKDHFNNENDFIFLATGYLIVPDAGIYEFNVLNDDGFQFQIELGPQKRFVFSDSFLQPLHPPQHFTKSVELSPGLYPFSLLSFEHLEASVIRLSWKKPRSQHHELVPTDHFRGSVPN